MNKEIITKKCKSINNQKNIEKLSMKLILQKQSILSQSAKFFKIL